MLPALALGVGLVNAGLSIKSGLDAASLKRQAAREAARRLKLSHDQVIGEATARGAASGVEFESSSLQTYLSTMTNEFRWQESYALKASMEEANALERSALWGGLGDAAGSMFSYGAQNNWFKKPTVG